MKTTQRPAQKSRIPVSPNATAGPTSTSAPQVPPLTNSEPQGAKGGNTSASGATTVAGSQAPPPPPPNASQTFLASVTAIFAGRISKPEELFQPLRRFDPVCEGHLGTVQSQRTREFFSLSNTLREKILHEPAPKTPDQVAKYERNCKRLAEQAKLAMDLFWQEIHAEFPNTAALGGTVDIRAGWKVVTCESPEQRLREQLEGMADRFGFPPEFLEHLARTVEPE